MLGGHFVAVWVGSSTAQPTMGEVLIETRVAEDGPILESKLITASATSGPLTLTGLSSTVINALAVVGADGSQLVLNVVNGVLASA